MSVPMRSPGRPGPAMSPIGTIAIAAIVAILASVITTVALGGLREPGAEPTASQASNASTRPAPPSAAGTDTAAPSAADGTNIEPVGSGTVATAAAKIAPAVVLVESSGGSGTGFVVSPDGLIMTNQHVVDADKRVRIALADGRKMNGTVIAVDTLTDLALIRVKATGLTAAELGDSGALSVGQPVVAIGDAIGFFANTVTSGVVSGLSRGEFLDDSGVYRNMIQTDAAINHGNSGGPLVDLAGRVVGINSLIISRESGAEGLGFSIPIAVARPIIDQAIAGKPLSRPFLGVRYTPVDKGVQERNKLTVDHGALLAPQPSDTGVLRPAVVADGPAARAGLRKGDVIVAIEDRTIDLAHPLEIVVVQFAAGDTVAVHIVRDGVELAVPVKLGTKK